MHLLPFLVTAGEAGPDAAELQKIDELLYLGENQQALQLLLSPPTATRTMAIALGAQAKYSDTKTQIHQSREIKDSIERAIALIIYGGLPKASLAKAEELLLQAIVLHDRVSHRYNLAKVYDRMERTEDVQLQLRTALQLPVTFPEELEEQEKARKKLENGNSYR